MEAFANFLGIQGDLLADSVIEMSRKVRKGILGVPRRAERQVFVFGRFAEELPSDDSDDSDFNPSKEEENASTVCTLSG